MPADIETGNGTTDFLNFGILTLKPPRPAALAKDDTMTVIVSGVGRSGTSMTAGVLGALGIPMGETKSAVVEDEDFLHALFHFDFERMAKLAQIRNAQFKKWGFKFASLQNHMLPPQLNSFRNAVLIIVMRDPVAIASRATISDPNIRNASDGFFNVSKQSYDMANFLAKVMCPVLLISYEKFLSFPDQAIDAIAGFCGIEVSETARALARTKIAPNNVEYLKLFHKDFKGHINGIRGGILTGWCSSLRHADPVTVEVLADGKVVASKLANKFREDLKRAGIGEGSHAFEIEMEQLGLSDTASIAVRVAGTEFLLQGSNVTVANLHRG